MTGNAACDRCGTRNATLKSEGTFLFCYDRTGCNIRKAERDAAPTGKASDDRYLPNGIAREPCAHGYTWMCPQGCYPEQNGGVGHPTAAAPIVGAQPADNACKAPRFFIDHDVIHDRVTGKHVRSTPREQMATAEDGIEECCALLNKLADEAADNLALLARGVELFGEDHVPTFEEAWKRKEAEGYQYGEDALAQVRFGWEIRSKYAGLAPAAADSSGAAQPGEARAREWLQANVLVPERYRDEWVATLGALLADVRHETTKACAKVCGNIHDAWMKNAKKAPCVGDKDVAAGADECRRTLEVLAEQKGCSAGGSDGR